MQVMILTRNFVFTVLPCVAWHAGTIIFIGTIKTAACSTVLARVGVTWTQFWMVKYNGNIEQKIPTIMHVMKNHMPKNTWLYVVDT